MIFVTEYFEHLDLGGRKGCFAYIDEADDGAVYARMMFYNNGKNTYNINICKDTDDEVIVPKRSHKGKRFPEYVKRVLNVLSRLVLPSIYYRECVIE